jgi:hypothetical protein
VTASQPFTMPACPLGVSRELTFALLHRSSAPLCTFALTDCSMSPCQRAP